MSSKFKHQDVHKDLEGYDTDALKGIIITERENYKKHIKEAYQKAMELQEEMKNTRTAMKRSMHVLKDLNLIMGNEEKLPSNEDKWQGKDKTLADLQRTIKRRDEELLAEQEKMQNRDKIIAEMKTTIKKNEKILKWQERQIEQKNASIAKQEERQRDRDEFDKKASLEHDKMDQLHPVSYDEAVTMLQQAQVRYIEAELNYNRLRDEVLDRLRMDKYLDDVVNFEGDTRSLRWRIKNWCLNQSFPQDDSGMPIKMRIWGLESGIWEIITECIFSQDGWLGVPKPPSDTETVAPSSVAVYSYKELKDYLLPGINCTQDEQEKFQAWRAATLRLLHSKHKAEDTDGALSLPRQFAYRLCVSEGLCPSYDSDELDEIFEVAIEHCTKMALQRARWYFVIANRNEKFDSDCMSDVEYGGKDEEGSSREVELITIAPGVAKSGTNDGFDFHKGYQLLKPIVLMLPSNHTST